MRLLIKNRLFVVLGALVLALAACAQDEPDTAEPDDPADGTADDTGVDAGVDADDVGDVGDVGDDDAMDDDAADADMGDDDAMDDDAADADMGDDDAMDDDAADADTGDDDATDDSAQACDADALVAAVEGGPEDGTLAGMTDDPVATAASNNPVLTTLATAVDAAGLVDTLNGAEALTVFAPTDCAFDELDPEVLDAALADPEGLLTEVLGFHVIAGEQLGAADFADGDTFETFTGQTLEVSVDGDVVTIGGGQAEVLVPDIETANATVHLIDAVMLPPMEEGMDDGATDADDDMDGEMDEDEGTEG